MDTSRNQPNDNPAPAGDYLWDRTGTPDPELQKLEVLLAEFRHNRPTPVLAEQSFRGRWASIAQLRWFPALAAAAAIALTVFVTFLMLRNSHSQPATAGWEVSRLSGSPRIGRNTITGPSRPARLGIGQILETDDQSRASLHSPEIGQIDIDPGTRLRLLTMGQDLKRIALDRGTIHAYIWAPAGQFVVDTPSAVTVDLGCAYTLHVDDSGDGLVRTTLGWVGFKLNRRESFIPAGAACATRPKIGPGTPYFEDASEPFRSALSRIDFKDLTPQQRDDDIATILAQARVRDSITLWHLLSRVDDAQRARVFDRLNQLAPPPAGVTREGVLRLDQSMLDRWWNELGFDDISIWRHWEHSWSSETAPSAK
jgi:hypothetical protein